MQLGMCGRRVQTQLGAQDCEIMLNRNRKFGLQASKQPQYYSGMCGRCTLPRQQYDIFNVQSVIVDFLGIREQSMVWRFRRPKLYQANSKLSLVFGRAKLRRRISNLSFDRCSCARMQHSKNGLFNEEVPRARQARMKGKDM
eukprot:973918-Pleurochrysis_carterae.AAC.3